MKPSMYLLQGYGSCIQYISLNQTSLLCKTGPAINTTHSGFNGYPSIRNIYGELFTVEGNVLIHTDPEFVKVQSSVSGDNIQLTFQVSSR